MIRTQFIATNTVPLKSLTKKNPRSITARSAAAFKSGSSNITADSSAVELANRLIDDINQNENKAAHDDNHHGVIKLSKYERGMIANKLARDRLLSPQAAIRQACELDLRFPVAYRQNQHQRRQVSIMDDTGGGARKLSLFDAPCHRDVTDTDYHDDDDDNDDDVSEHRVGKHHVNKENDEHVATKVSRSHNATLDALSTQQTILLDSPASPLLHAASQEPVVLVPSSPVRQQQQKSLLSSSPVILQQISLSAVPGSNLDWFRVIPDSEDDHDGNDDDDSHDEHNSSQANLMTRFETARASSIISPEARRTYSTTITKSSPKRGKNKKQDQQQKNNVEPDNNNNKLDKMSATELRAMLKQWGFKPPRSKADMISLVELYGSRIMPESTTADLNPDTTTMTMTSAEMRQATLNRISEFITTDKDGMEWWMRMLTYEPIVAEDFTSFLVHKKILVTNDAATIVREWCDSMSVCFTTKDVTNG
ncbi:hypothetical protein V1514DRAFT_109177 [Lipomyces japonicus]|uniref:uncharacterized protein n=1 Tax=Lipomyces japonicus TaxID=56871 RepID=UPI0034CDE008